MKKIGIVTFHESDNYGTVLQAFALQTLLEEIGCEADIINYSRPSIINGSKKVDCIVNRICSVIKAYGLLDLNKRSTIKDSQRMVKERFREFRSNRLHYSKQKISSVDDLRMIEKEYDAFVVGSDMVWSFDRSQNLDLYFLKFTDSHKRISYAPSFGLSVIDEDKRDEYKNGLLGFNNLSCREKSGIKLIKDLTGKEAVLTADPTIACSESAWSSFRTITDLPQRYILVYMFEGIPKWMMSNITEIARIYEAEIIEIPVEVRGWCRNIKNHKNIIVGPEEFVDLFKNAACVITNSYHGLMFSIIFSKPFFVTQRSSQRWGQFEERLTDMLKRIGCEDRLIPLNSHVNSTLLRDEKMILLNRIKELKEQSIQYISIAIESINSENDNHI